VDQSHRVAPLGSMDGRFSRHPVVRGHGTQASEACRAISELFHPRFCLKSAALQPPRGQATNWPLVRSQGVGAPLRKTLGTWEDLRKFYRADLLGRAADAKAGFCS
jgi:hypothetical protein